MVGVLGHDHLRQQACAGSALLNRLRWLGRRLHRARAGVGEASILDDFHLRRNILVALADFLADSSQVLIAVRAMLVAFWQIVLDALTSQVPRQRFSSARLLLPRCIGRWVVALVSVWFCPSRLRHDQTCFGR